MLHATRAQVFAVVGTEDLFLLLQKDAAVEPKQRLLPVAGMWAVPHLTPKERGNATAYCSLKDRS